MPLPPDDAAAVADEDGTELLDHALAEPRHLLVLSADVAMEEVDALAASHFDDAGWLGPSMLRLTGSAHLTGPWRLDDALRRAFDLPAWAAVALLLRCPVQRSGPVPPELLGLGGLLDAFPDGPPTGLEGQVLDHLLAQARRLRGALRVAGTGAVLVPEPASAVDLTLYSPVWLEPEACVRVLEPVLPGVRSSVDGSVGENPSVGKGYAAVSDLGADGSVEVMVAEEERPPTPLRGVSWARRGVIAYEIRWRPLDPELAFGPRPPLGLRRARGRARLLVERATVALHDVVGGDVCDDDEFLVAVGELATPG